MGFVRRAAPPLLGVLLALGLFSAARGLDEVAQGPQLGPGFWPRLVLVGLGLACAAQVAAAARRRRPGRVEPAPGTVADAEPAQLGEISRARLVVAMGLIVLYVLATPWVGFPLATVAFIAAFLWLCGTRSPRAVAGNTVVGTTLLLYVFLKLVYLPLPKGAGPFETLTLAVYRALRIF